MQQTRPPQLHQTQNLASRCQFENTQTAAQQCNEYNHYVWGQTTRCYEKWSWSLVQFYKLQQHNHHFMAITQVNLC